MVKAKRTPLELNCKLVAIFQKNLIVDSPALARNNKIHIALHPGSKLNPLIHSVISHPQVGIPIKGYFIAFARLSQHDFWTFTRQKYIWASAWHVLKIASVKEYGCLQNSPELWYFRNCDVSPALLI